MRTAAVVGLACMVVLGASCSGDGGDRGGGSGPVDETTATTESVVSPATSFAGSSAVVIAHRGDSGSGPEHTFAAYDRALEAGADYLELDLQLTADGVPVVLHDPTLDRTVRGPAERCTGPVAGRTAEDLEACDAGAWFGEGDPGADADEFAGEPIPTLAQVLDRYGDRAHLYIEIKSPDEQPGLAEALLAELDGAEVANGDGTVPPVVVQSFIGDALRAIHDREPELPLVQLVAPGGDLGEETLDRIADYAVAVAPNKADVTPELVVAANERCLDVHPWTVDDPDEMAELLEAGAGAIFTNEPGRLVEVREQAPPRPELCQPTAGGSS